MVDLKHVDNIIFDLGGVIININPKLSIEAFQSLGFSNVESRIFSSGGLKFLHAVEKGRVNAREFYSEIRKMSGCRIPDKLILQAWNKMLLDIPEKRIRLIENLKNKYRIFLLSNTNRLHYRCYTNQLREKYLYSNFNCLFEKSWFSFNISMIKPDIEIYNFVIKDAGLDPHRTLFIDDSYINIEGAGKACLKTFHLIESDITEIFRGLA